jgi:predicted acyl esterase
MRLAITAIALAIALLPATASAADVPPGAVWSEATIASTDGVQLHADILRPAQATGRTPDPGHRPVLRPLGADRRRRAGAGHEL